MGQKLDAARLGMVLFRWRSYLPLLLFAILVPALRDFRYPLDNAVADCLWELLCLSLAFAGLAVRCHTSGTVPAGTSGRNTKRQKASVLNMTGWYSVVRNPLYLAALFTRSPIAIAEVIFRLGAKVVTVAKQRRRLLARELHRVRRQRRAQDIVEPHNRKVNSPLKPGWLGGALTSSA